LWNQQKNSITVNKKQNNPLFYSFRYVEMFAAVIAFFSSTF